METNLQYITIPIDILQMDIPLTHKFILALSKMKDGCYLKNSVIANLLGLSKSRVSHIISELVKMGLIEVELEYKPLSKEVSKRTIISKVKDVVAVERQIKIGGNYKLFLPLFMVKRHGHIGDDTLI